MPGLNQLKQFNSDLLNLGDEVKIRSARGEKPSIVPIPKNVEDRDDSEDFRQGMPMLSEEEQAQADAAIAEKEKAKNDFSDITGIGGDEEDEEPAFEVPAAPDVSGLLDSSDLSMDDVDLSDFDTPPEPSAPPPKKEVPIEDLDLDDLLGLNEEKVEEDLLQEITDLPSDPEELSPVEKPASGPVVEEEISLDAFDDVPEAPAVEEFKMPEDIGGEDHFDFGDDAADLSDPELIEDAVEDVAVEEVQPEEEPLTMVEEEPSFETSFSDSTPDFGFDDFASDAGAMDMGSEDSLGMSDELGDLDLNFETDNADSSVVPDASDDLSGEDIQVDIPDDIPEAPVDMGTDSDMDFSMPDDVSASEENTDVSEPVESAGEEFSTSDDMGSFEMPEMDESAFGTGDEEGAGDTQDVASDSFEMPETDAVNSGESFEAPSSGEADMDSSMDFEMPSDIGVADSGESFDVPDFGAPSGDGMDFGSEPLTGEPGAEEMSFDLPDMGSGSDYNLPDFDFGNMNGGGEGVSPDMEVSDSEFETFDTSSINNLDFSSDEGSDFELGNITTQEADEDDLFSIPGFSDTVTADLNKNRKPEVETPDFSDAIEDESGRVKNTFSDNEYKRFQQNLETYPLNIRIAIEDLVVKNEFTDDAVFAILEKVYKKAPARQIASELEKMLDVSLDVPRDFERRTAAEYEAYKKSLEYQLRNRILPAAILTTAAAILVACLFLIVRTFIVFPVTANNLYKQGYVLLENGQYDQALERFNDAVAYKDVKEWYYKYAKSFREHKQYDRATSMYKAILAFFDHEKRAGMEWADMECNDLFNYEETERILKREVLDYHINDLEAITMLGDLYLDWATEKDSSKFPLAKAEYDRLLELGSASEQNKYLSRQMRYYIRTDNLRQVLGYKEYFFDIKGKSGLGAKDLTELSGYLLDKLYGTLTPAEESMRFNIENVRELLERAVEADPNNPVSLYNMGRYFVETNNRSAVSLLKTSIDRFNVQTKRTRAETYKYINCYRLLGEEYRDQQEYILAEQTYGNGITLFERENYESGFASDANVGKLYADMADLDYFISGDMDQAYTNYVNSINNKNDTSSIRYRIGYIQYKKGDYAEALGSFIRSSETAPTDTHLLLAMGNTLHVRGDNYAAQGYYERLLGILNGERELHEVLFPQVRSDQADLVDVYMKASNNLGVTYSRIAEATGKSSMNAKALVNLQESLRAWDAMTRNQDTYVRLEGSNLAEQNIKYITNPKSAYDPEIYTDIFKLMNGEEGLK